MVIQRYSGFTIIELMIVISVVGVLAVIGLPSMRDLMFEQQVKTAASDTHISLLLTRSEAIKRNTDIEMRANTSWNNGWNVKIPASTVLRTQDPIPGITVECNTDSDSAAETCPAAITFSRAGRPTSYIEFRLFMEDNPRVTMRCVSVSLSGVPRVKLDMDNDTDNGCN